MKTIIKLSVIAIIAIVFVFGCSKELPLSSQEESDNHSSNSLSKKPGGGPSTWIGTATLRDGVGDLISSDGDGPYTDCRIGGDDMVQIELDAKGQLDRLDAFLGQHCQTQNCGSNSSRTVSIDLPDVEPEEGLSETAGLLYDAIREAIGEQIVIQVWPSSAGSYALYITCMASSSLRRDVLELINGIDQEELLKYMFRVGPDCEPGTGDDALDFSLGYTGGAQVSGPASDGSYTITPLPGLVKLDLLIKDKPQFQRGRPVFLAIYDNVPFELTVTKDGQP